MNKSAIIQKLVNNEKVSDSLFRKICQFLDMADKDDADGIADLFASEIFTKGKPKTMTGAERTRRWRGKRSALPDTETEDGTASVTENDKSVTIRDENVTGSDDSVTMENGCDGNVTECDVPVTDSVKEKQEKKRSKRKEGKETINFGISSQSESAVLLPGIASQSSRQEARAPDPLEPEGKVSLKPDSAEYWRCFRENAEMAQAFWESSGAGSKIFRTSGKRESRSSRCGVRLLT